MTKKEEWRPVVGFEGFYEVSNLGRVRSVDRYVNAKGRWGLEVRHYKGRVLRLRVMGTCKYLMARVSRGNRAENRTVHSLVAAAFLGPCPAGSEIRHLDCDNLNNCVSNLAYGTRRVNREDSRRAGTLAVGERIAQHKLKTAEVLEIRQATGRHEDIAASYGVSRTQISRIKRGENWTHV